MERKKVSVTIGKRKIYVLKTKQSSSSRDGDKKSFKVTKEDLMSFGRSSSSSRDGEKKSFGYKGKSSFTKKR